MNIFIVLAVILAGSLLESAFAFLLSGKPEPKEDICDDVMDARYSRMSRDLGFAEAA